LKNLSVKQDAINRLVSMPIRVAQGTVGRIELTIPWTQLASQPTIVRLSDVFVLAEPSAAYSEPASVEESKRKRLAVLDETERASLVTGAAVAAGGGAAGDSANSADLDNSSSTFTQRTIAAVISNLQVFVDTVHVRYEDSVTNPSEPFAVGVTLDHFAMQACNFVGEPVVANVLADVIYKAVQLRNFAVYWNPSQPALKFANHAELAAQLRATMHTAEKPVASNSYLLQPVSALVQVSMKKSDVPDMTAAKFSVAFDFEELQLVLNDAQFRDMLRVVSFASAWAKKAPYSKLWKRVMTTDGWSTARRRWAYGTGAVLQDVHTRRERFNWPWIKAFGRKRRAFLAFHTLWLDEVPPKSDAYRELERVHDTTMDKLIDELPYDDIVFLRALATMQFKRSGALARWRERRDRKTKQVVAAAAAESTGTSDKSNSGGGGFFSKMFGNKKEKSAAASPAATTAVGAATPAASATSIVHMNEQEWKELTDTFGLLEQKSSTQRVSNAPPEYVFARALGKVRGGGARLESLQRDGTKQPVAMVKWSDFRLNVAMRPTSLSVSGSLGSLVAVDCVTVDPVFPNMIDRLVSSVAPAQSGIDFLPPPPLLSFAIDQHPLDKKNVDLFVKADMQPLLVVYNFVAIDRIVKFFDSPGASLADIDALREQSASATRLAMMRRETEQRFLLAIEQQSTIGVDIDIVAPRIVAPMQVSRAASSAAAPPFVAAVIDLGHLRFKSRESTGLKELSAQLIGTVAQKVEERDEFYDWFDITADNLNCGITTSSDTLQYASLFEPISLQTQIAVCKIRTGTLLTTVRISAQLANLHLAVTASQVNTLLRIATALSKQVVDATSADAAALASALEQSRSRRVALQSATAQFDAVAIASEREGDAEVLARATLINFAFGVASTRLTLLAETPVAATTATAAVAPLIVADLSGLSIGVVKRTFDMRVGVHLASIEVADRFQTYGERFARLISTPVVATGSSDAKAGFIDVVYQASDRESPFFDKNDHTVDIQISRLLEVALNRATVTRMLEFALTAQKGIDAAAPATSASDAAAPSATDATLEQLAQSRLVVSVNAAMQGVSVLLHQERQALAQLSVRQLAVKLTSTAAGAIDIVGTLKAVQVDNLLPAVVIDEHRRVLYATGDEVVRVNLTLLSPTLRARSDAANVAMLTQRRSSSQRGAVRADPPALEADGTVKACIQSLQLVFVTDFFLQLYLCVLSMVGDSSPTPGAPASTAAATTTTTSTAAPATAAATKFIFGFDVELSKLLVVVPASEKSYDALRFDLGTCRVANRIVSHELFSQSADLALIEQRLRVAITSMNVVSQLPSHDAEDESMLDARLIDNFDISVDVAMAQSFRGAPVAMQAAARQALRVAIAVTPVRLRSDTDQWNLLLDAIHMNLCKLPASLVDEPDEEDVGDNATKSRRRRRRQRVRNTSLGATRVPRVMGASDSGGGGGGGRKALMISAASDEASSARSSEDDDALQAEPVLSDHDDDDFDDDLVRQSSKSVFETMQLDLVLSEVALVTANVLHHKGAEEEALAVGALPDCLQFSVRKLELSMHSYSDNGTRGSLSIDSVRIRDARPGSFTKRAFRDLLTSRIGANEKRTGAMVTLKFDLAQSESKSAQRFTVDVGDVAIVVLPDVLNELLIWFFPVLEDTMAALDAYRRFSLALSRNMLALVVTLGPPLVQLSADVNVARARFALVESMLNADSLGFVGALVAEARYTDEQRRDATTHVTQRTQQATANITADLSKCFLAEYDTTALPIAPQIVATAKWSTGMSWPKPTASELAFGIQPTLLQSDPTLLAVAIADVLDLTLSYRDVTLALVVLQSFATIGQGAAPSAASIDEAAAVAAAMAAAASGNDVDSRTVMNVDMRGIDVTLVNDVSAERHAPLLYAAVRPSHISVRDWHVNDVKTRVVVDSVRVDYFNTALRVWEPLLEPCNAELLLRGVHTTLTAPRPLQLTITKAFLDTALATLALVSAPETDPSKETSEQRRKQHAAGLRLRQALRTEFRVQNALGVRVRCWVGDDTTMRSLPPNALTGLVVNFDERMRQHLSHRHTERHHKTRDQSRTVVPDCDFTLQLDVAEGTASAAIGRSATRIQHLPLLHGSGNYLLLPFSATPTIQLLYRVDADDDGGAGKLVTLSSPFAVQNDTDVPVELRCVLPNGIALLSSAATPRSSDDNNDDETSASDEPASLLQMWTFILSPGARVSVPLMVHAYGSIAVRPAPIAGDEPSHGFSKALRCGDGLLWPRVHVGSNEARSIGASTFLSMFQLRCASTATHDPNALDWHCAVHVRCDPHDIVNAPRGATSSRGIVYTMTLAPAFVVTNALPHPIQVRWQCHATSTVLFEAEVGVGDAMSVCCAANPHWIAIAPDDDPALPWTRRGNGEQALSILLPGFKWSEEALIVRRASKSKASFTSQMLRDCATHTNAIDMLQRTLKVRLGMACQQLSVHLTLYVDVWLVNRCGLPLLVGDGAGKLLASGNDDAPGAQSGAGLASGGEPRDWYAAGFAADAPPLLLSASHNSVSRVRVADSEWCAEELSLGETAVGGVMTLPQSRKTAQGVKRAMVGAYELTAVVQPLSDVRFWRTKQVIFAARYVLVNCNKREDFLVVQDEMPTPPMSLLASEQVPWHWPDRARPMRLRVTAASGRWNWSGAFELTSLGETMLMLRSSQAHSEHRRFIMVRATLIDGQTLVQLATVSSKRPRLRIINELPAELAANMFVSQTGTRDTHSPIAVPRDEVVPFAWDEPCGEHALYVEAAGIKTELSVSELGYEHAIGRNVYATVLADGPTRNVYIRARVDHATATANAVSAATMAVAAVVAEVPKQVLSVQLHSIGISLVDRTPQELLYVTIEGVRYDLATTDARETLQVTVDNVQIDNQLFCSPNAAIVLFPKPAKRKNDELCEFVKFVYVRVLGHQKKIDHFEYVSLLVQELFVDLDEPLLLLLLEFVNTELLAALSAAPSSDTDLALVPSGAPPLPPAGRTPALAQPLSARMIYIALLQLNPMRVNVTFRASSSRAATATTGDGAASTASASAAAASSGENKLERLLRASGSVGLSNISNAPVRLNALLTKYVFSTWTEVQTRVTTHYMQQVLSQVHRLLGASAAIGNPVGLVSNLGAGVKDFFYEPAQGLTESPAAFGRGVARGTRSLIENSVYGIFNSVSGLTETAATALSTASFDARYQREREQRRAAQQPAHAGQGVLMGGLSVARGIVQGVTGIVTEPVRGAREGGALGFARGLGRGVVGVVVKPVIGVVDMASDLTSGVKNSTSVEARRPLPRRWPRACGDGRTPLLPYDAVAARGAVMLRATRSSVNKDDIEEALKEASDALDEESALDVAARRDVLNEQFVAMWQVGTVMKRNLKHSVYTCWLVLSTVRLVSMRVKELDRENTAHAKYFHAKTYKCDVDWSEPVFNIAVAAGWPRLVPFKEGAIDGTQMQLLVTDVELHAGKSKQQQQQQQQVPKQRTLTVFVNTPRHDAKAIARALANEIATMQASRT
jgi:hypothetical protein